MTDYDSGDCGLVFKNLLIKDSQSATDTECKCKKLVNFVEWYFNECFGYDCPISRYRCEECHRIYKAPHYDREAIVEVQDSRAAVEYVKRTIRFKQQQESERIQRAIDDATRLKELLRHIPKDIRRRITENISAD